MDNYHRNPIVLLSACYFLSSITIATNGPFHHNNFNNINRRIASSNDVHTGSNTFHIDYENDTFVMNGKPFR